MAQAPSDVELLESKIADSKQRRDHLEQEARNLARQRNELNDPSSCMISNVFLAL